MLILKQKHGMFSTAEFNLNTCFTLNDSEILIMRKAICQQYVNKKVVVATSTSKVYFSSTEKMDNSTVNFTPEWIYYTTGVVALIYDSTDLTLALFEKSTIKLLWSLSWKSHTCFSSPASNFHVINLDSYFTKHVGMLHENETAANLITTSIKTFCLRENVKSLNDSEWINKDNAFLNQKNHIRNFPQKLLNENFVNKMSAENSLHKLSNSNFSQKNTAQLDLKPCVRRVKSENTFSNKKEDEKNNQLNDATELNVSSSKQNQANDTTETQVIPSKFTRANSFRNSNQPSTKEENSSVVCEEKKKPKNSGEKEDSLIKTLFKKKIVSRSHSLQDKSCSEKAQLSHGFFTSDSKKNLNENKKSNRLIKLRSATDSSIVCGNSVKYNLETGSVAKQEWENKYWKLEDKNVLSTDLCVTEL